MKTSILLVALVFITVMSWAQQTSKYRNSDSNNEKYISTDISFIFEGKQFSVLISQKYNEPGNKIFSVPSLAGEEFNHNLFYQQLAATPQIVLKSELMQSIAEILSYSNNILISGKKYSYTTGFTGKGVGILLIL